MANCIPLLCLYKWKVIERYETYKRKWYPDWCELCFFFWLSMIEYILYNLNMPIGFYTALYVLLHSFACCFTSLILIAIYRRLTR